MLLLLLQFLTGCCYHRNSQYSRLCSHFCTPISVIGVTPIFNRPPATLRLSHHPEGDIYSSKPLRLLVI